jgi:hypothetical protein
MNNIRKCEECAVCCVITEISEDNFHKCANYPCEYLNNEGYGCSLFGKKEKPNRCTEYECAWLRGFGGDNDRPDKSNIMLFINSFNGGIWIFAMETKKDAYRTTGKSIIVDMVEKFDLPIIISDFDSKPPYDKGDYVVIKNELEYKSNQIKGDFIYELENDIKVYKLKISE